MNDDLAAFPYVNGGLFSDESIEIPRFTPEIVSLLLDNASAGFDWAEISPTIFGAVFESTLNQDTRRSNGMHYTSIENIHKVIDPLFLGDLRTELDKILAYKTMEAKRPRLIAFQEKLASLTFFAPACGSGNFLTESYLCLRRMENEVLSALTGGQSMLSVGNEWGVRVCIGQFYGIEINDFAVSVAKTALWIAEHQMLRQTEEIMQVNLDFLPLKSYANITEGNALRTDWRSVAPKNLSYLMGNPPFVGARMMSPEQKSDVFAIFKGVKNNGNLDYVSCWYQKAVELMQGTTARAALVSTNSITQGEQVAVLWKPLFENYGIHIDFAYRTFRWDSKASIQAHVHCVIVGFSIAENPKTRLLFDGDQRKEAENINAYLLDVPNIFISRRTTPICDVAPMHRGSQPTDDGNLILTEEEKDELIRKEPLTKKMIRPFMMGKDFINRKPRYCLWLCDISPAEMRKCPQVLKRIEKVRQFRLASKKAATRLKAETPMLFDENQQPKTDFIAIPKVSSENRKYIPMDYLSKDIIAGDKLFVVEDATLYHFGVLTSNVHNAWMRTVGGRLEMRYRYSGNVVYNNFPWCTPTDKQRAQIEKTAQGILDARANHPDSSLADLYDERTMPADLRRAHRLGDFAVMAAYGFPRDITESECVARLMVLWKVLEAS